MTITPDAGIDIDTASWAAGSCSITDNVASCEANSLAAQSNTQLQIGVTGTSEGSRSYSVTASAAEADRNGANNNVSGQLTVGSTTTGSPGGGNDSGGGSFGWLFLMSLALVRRRRLSRC